MKKRFVDLLTYLVVRILICIVQAVRIETAARWARHLAWLFAEVLRVRNQVVDENLRHAFDRLSVDERKVLTRRMWEHLFLLVVEVAHAPRKIHETNWRDYVQLSNDDTLIRHMLSDRPTIVLSGHYGNFEAGGYLLGLLGFPTYTVARTLDNPYLDRFVNRFRGLTGQYIIPKNGGYDQVLSVLAVGGTMMFLADQYAGAKGCWVEFFGRPASAHKAIALLALEHDSPVTISYARRLERPLQFELKMTASLDPREITDEPNPLRHVTQWYTHRLEEMVREHPEQYWWIHRRWKDNRMARRKRRSQARAA